MKNKNQQTKKLQAKISKQVIYILQTECIFDVGSVKFTVFLF